MATRDRDGWILNGGKKWIGLAPYAAFNVVLAKLDHDGRDAGPSPWSSTWNQTALAVADPLTS